MSKLFGKSVSKEHASTERGYGLRRATALALIVLFLGASAPILGHQAHNHTGKDQGAAAGSDQSSPPPRRGGSRWGADYFPNIPLVTHEGKSVRFFDDLVKDKVVAINFIYTDCPDSCPLETARLVNVQQILGDRVGRDVFMYSITIDPAHDTPEVLKKYAEKFRIGPGWLFLTGKEADITLLRKKLGMYSEETDKDLTDHNLSLIIGNQSTGQWMKRSPFDNPYFLAAQIGSWLTTWRRPSDAPVSSYAEAPKLRNISQGETLFRGRCAACHTIGEGDIMKLSQQKVGPDLLGVTRKRDRAWLVRWIAEPDRMLAEKDPIAMDLYAKYNNMPMPNLRLSEHEVNALIEYMEAEDRRIERTAAAGGATGERPEDSRR